jgi:curved DNA-binding protein CbpA
MDNFALLGQLRQPWLDAGSLKSAFLEISARIHPDRVQAAGMEERAAATRRFAEVNAAYNCLREPKERLLHLLELELGAPPASVQSVRPDMMDLHMETGRICREADRFLATKARAESPLLAAPLFEQGVEWTGRLQAPREQIQLRREGLLAELQGMNAAWKSAPHPASSARAGALPLRRLEEICRTLGYLARCEGQIQERLAQLSF